MLPSPIELKYFYEVANTLNFSKAAVNLHVSQPSLSIAIKRLETTMKQNLFIRHKQGVSLTHSGHLLLNEVKTLLEKWSAISANINGMPEVVSGNIRIGCNAAIHDVMSHFSAQLMQTHTELAIHLEHALTVDIIAKLGRGDLDIGIVINPAAHPDIILKKINEVEFTCWQGKKHAANFEWDGAMLICDPSLAQTQNLLKLHPHLAKLKLVTTNQLDTIANMTLESNGIGLLPACFVQGRYHEQLQRIANAPCDISYMYLAYNYQNKNNAAVQAVWQAMKSYHESINAN